MSDFNRLVPKCGFGKEATRSFIIKNLNGSIYHINDIIDLMNEDMYDLKLNEIIDEFINTMNYLSFYKDYLYNFKKHRESCDECKKK